MEEEMLKRLLVYFTIFYLCISFINSFENKKSDKFEQILHELGAFSYARERGKDRLYKRNIRIDFNGWISPYDFELVKFSEKEKMKLKLPTSKERMLEWYRKYKSLLDIDKYKKSKDLNHLTIMKFLLEIAWAEKTKIDNKEKLIKLLKAGIGLELEILKVITNSLTFKIIIPYF
jgi:hypothetical protein